MIRTWVGACAAVATLFASTAQAEDIRVMTSGGFTAAYKILGPQFAGESGNTLETTLGPSMGQSPEAIPNRLARGEQADVVIMVGYALDDLIKKGVVDPKSRVELADSRIGMVVRQGEVVPDIRTVDALRRALMQAKSIAYSDSASGVTFSVNCSSGSVSRRYWRQGEEDREDPGGLGRRQWRVRDRFPAGERAVAGVWCEFRRTHPGGRAVDHAFRRRDSCQRCTPRAGKGVARLHGCAGRPDGCEGDGPRFRPH
jgi:hypothetical protein